MSKTNQIGIVGGVSAKTKDAYVEVTLNEERVQMDVEAARELAHNILEAAENGVHDAALFDFLTKELKVDEDGAIATLNGIRIYRRDRWGQPDRSALDD